MRGSAELTIVVPTLNERANIGLLVAKARRAETDSGDAL